MIDPAAAVFIFTHTCNIFPHSTNLATAAAEAVPRYGMCRCFEQALASKFIIMRVRPGWCTEGHKVYIGLG